MSTHKCSHVTRVSSWITLRRRGGGGVPALQIFLKVNAPLHILWRAHVLRQLLLFSHISNREKARKLKNKSIKYFASACGKKNCTLMWLNFIRRRTKNSATRKKRRVFIEKILNENARARLIEMENLHTRAENTWKFIYRSPAAQLVPRHIIFLFCFIYRKYVAEEIHCPFCKAFNSKWTDKKNALF